MVSKLHSFCNTVKWEVFTLEGRLLVLRMKNVSSKYSYDVLKCRFLLMRPLSSTSSIFLKRGFGNTLGRPSLQVTRQHSKGAVEKSKEIRDL